MRIHLGSKEGWSKGSRDVGAIQIPFFKLLLASICPRFRTFDWTIIMGKEEFDGAIKNGRLFIIVPIERQSKKYIITKAKRIRFEDK